MLSMNLLLVSAVKDPAITEFDLDHCDHIYCFNVDTMECIGQMGVHSNPQEHNNFDYWLRGVTMLLRYQKTECDITELVVHTENPHSELDVIEAINKGE